MAWWGVSIGPVVIVVASVVAGVIAGVVAGAVVAAVLVVAAPLRVVALTPAAVAAVVTGLGLAVVAVVILTLAPVVIAHLLAATRKNRQQSFVKHLMGIWWRTLDIGVLKNKMFLSLNLLVFGMTIKYL